MTYKEIVDRVKDIVFRHKQLADFGYGSLSDIKTRSVNGPNAGNSEQADYPYVFLNPTSHTRTGQSITYRFNMIVMEMVKETDYLDGQSVCQQYIDDILSELRFGYTDQIDLTLNVSLTPFKERFQDTVAGMTATLEIMVPIALNQCIAPFVPTIGEQYIYVTEENPQTVDPDNGVSFGDVFKFTNEIEDPNEWNFNRWSPVETGTYTVEMEYSFQYENAPGVSAPPILSYRPTGLPTQSIEATEITGWPSTPQTGVTYTVKQTWEFVEILSPSTIFMQYYNTPSNEIALLVNAGASLKIYKSV